MQSQSLHLQTSNQSAINEEKENPLTIPYLTFIKSSVREVVGALGMLQHHFSTLEQADDLVKWLKAQEVLKNLDIDKAKPSKMNINGTTSYVVRLSVSQYKALTGEEDLKVILSLEKMTKLSSDIIASILAKNFDAFKQLIADPAIKASKLNQNRLINRLPVEESAFENLLIFLMHYNTAENLIVKSFVENIHPDILEKTLLQRTTETNLTILNYNANLKNGFDHAILEALRPKALKEFFSIIGTEGVKQKFTVLLHCYGVMKTEPFKNLLHFIGPEIVEEALQHPSNHLEVGLVDYILTQSTNFETLINFIGGEKLGPMLSANKTNQPTFYSAFNQLLGSVGNSRTHADLMATMKLISPDDLGLAAIYISNPAEKLTCLYTLLTNTSDEAALYALNKIPDDDLQAAFTRRAYDNTTIIHDVPKYRSEDVVKRIIELSSKNTLRNCCVGNDRKVIDWIFLYESSPTVVFFLEKLEDSSLINQFGAGMSKPIPKNYINKIAEGILNEPAWQREKLIQNMFTVMGKELAPIAIKHWNLNNPLSPFLVALVLKHYSFSTPEEAKGFSTYKPEEWYQPDFEEKVDNSPIKTSKGEILDPSNPNCIEKIWRDGLADWNQFRRLKAMEHQVTHLRAMLNELYTAGRVTTGSIADFIPLISDSKEENQLQYIIDRTLEENTLIKIVKDKDWVEFKNQLINYDYRFPLREAVDKTDKTYTHKYVHLQDKIIPYEGKRRKKANHTSTKKTSATLISKTLNTAVFGEHDAGRDLVGVLLNMELCKVKAMLTQDRGTFGRQWVGSLPKVEQYVQSIKGVSFKDIQQFRDAVRANPHRLNELLVKITREALMAIVIVTDSPSAREVALARQLEIQTEMKITAPIVLYDRPSRKMRLFINPEEQLNYQLKTNPGILSQKAMLPSKEFLSYLHHVSQETVSTAAHTQSINHGFATALHIAAASQDEATFLHFLKLMSENTIKQTAGLKDENMKTIFSIIAANQTETVLLTYVNRFKNLSILSTQITIGDLKTVLTRHTEKCFALICDTIEASDLIELSDAKKNNLFHIAAQLQKTATLSYLFKRLTQIPLLLTSGTKENFAPLLSQNDRQQTPLHIWASFTGTSSSNILLVSEQLDYQTRNQAIMLLDENNESFLHIAVKHQSEKFVSDLFDHLDIHHLRPHNLNQIAMQETKDQKTLLDLLFEHQPIYNAITLLNAVDADTLKFLLFHGNNPNSYILKLSDAIFYDTNKLPAEFITKLFSHLVIGPILLNTAQHLWLEGNNLAPIIMLQLKIHLNELSNADNTFDYTILKLATEESEVKEEKIGMPKTRLSKQIDISDATFIKTIWQEGIESWSDYRKLRRMAPNHPGLTETLDHLIKIGRLFEGSYQPFNATILDDSIANLHQLISHNSALVKIIDKDNWQDNLNKLIDPYYIPNNEALPETKPDSYEYLFMSTHRVEPYDPQRYNNHPHPSIARLISKDFNTILADASSQNPQVGFLIDYKYCERHGYIQAQLMTEGRLTSHEWIGSKSSVEEYAKEIRKYDSLSFDEVVSAKPNTINEVLVSIHPKSIKAIIIADDSLQSRQVARDRQEEIKNVLNIELPVIFYDSTLRRIKLYSAAEMEENKLNLDTGKLINIPKENEARARLLALKADIENNSTLKKFSFFGKVEAPKNAKAIVTLVNDAEQNPNTKWSDAFQLAKGMWSKAIKKPGKSRNADTQKFYEAEYEKYFKGPGPKP